MRGSKRTSRRCGDTEWDGTARNLWAGEKRILLKISVLLLHLPIQLCVNGFSILNGEMNSIATGLYLGVSILDHSCKPNAVGESEPWENLWLSHIFLNYFDVFLATFEGTTINIRLIEDLPVLDFSKVSTSVEGNWKMQKSRIKL